MLSKEDFMVIQALVRRGVYQRDIAERLGVHPRTVRRAVRRSGPPGGRRRRRPSLPASASSCQCQLNLDPSPASFLHDRGC